SLAAARPPAGLVQVRPLSLARGDRSARRAGRVRSNAGRRYRSARLGQHRGVALSRHAGTAGRKRTDERRSAGGEGYRGRGDRRGEGGPPQERSPSMTGDHDMGGDKDRGPNKYKKDEPVFHAPWEGRVYAINRALGAWRKWTIDGSRHGIELLPP